MSGLISIFSNCRATVPYDDSQLSEIIKLIADPNGRFAAVNLRHATNAIHAAKTKEAKNELKQKLPAATFAGTFSKRNATSITSATGLFAVDYDGDDPQKIEAALIKFKADKHTVAVWRSPSGNLKALVKFVYGAQKKAIDTDARYKEAFTIAAKYYRENFEIELDKNCKDICRLTFLSHDPQIFYNENAVPFELASEKKAAKTPKQTKYEQVSDYDKAKNAAEYLISNRVNITEGYDEWIRCGMALAHEMGENGRSYYHALSALSAKYERSQCDNKYSELLRNNKGSVTAGTLIQAAQSAGYEPFQKNNISNTNNVNNTNNSGSGDNNIDNSNRGGGLITLPAAGLVREKKPAGSYGVAYLTPSCNATIYPNAVAAVVACEKGGYDKNTFFEAMLRDLDIAVALNDVTERPEIRSEKLGKPQWADFSDIIFEEFIAHCLKVVRTVDRKAMYSFFIGKMCENRYNPIKDTLQNAKFKGYGHIAKYCSAVKLKEPEGAEGMNAEFFERTFTQWVVNAAALAFKEREKNETVIVFSGEMGRGKTEFFRNLAKPFADYYADGTFDLHNKDSYSLLCEHFLVNFDELGSYNKADITAFKTFVSLQKGTYRKPYAKNTGTYKRYASFCGSTNSTNFLRDEAGERRIVCFQVDSFDFNIENEVDIEALWAEAYQLYLDGYDYQTKPIVTAERIAHNKSFEVHDSLSEAIFQCFSQVDANTIGVNAKDGEPEPLGVELREIKQAVFIATHGLYGRESDIQFAASLRRHGITKIRARRRDGTRPILWQLSYRAGVRRE